MGTFINEKKMIDDTLFNYEEKFHSPMSRFIDKTPTFVTYFHIADDASTVGEGFYDVDDLVGNSSPLRYKRIENFPLYGIEAITPAVVDEEEGLTVQHEGDATLINSTIKPLPNDMFMIPATRDYHIFRVTAVNHDNIMKDNYFTISYRLEYIDEQKASWLNKQSIEKYQCILQNIGTDRKCIVRSDLYEKTEALGEMLKNMIDTYVSIFYSPRYNCFLGEMGGPTMKLYDPFQVEFMNRHDLMNYKKRLDPIIPTEHFSDSMRAIKYERSIYRFFERRDLHHVSNFKFITFKGSDNHETGFAKYFDDSVYCIDIPASKYIPPESVGIFSDEFVECMKTGKEPETRYGKVLVDYIRNDNMTIDNVPLDLEDELLQLNADVEIFFIIPIIIYCVRELIDKALYVKKDLTTIEF